MYRVYGKRWAELDPGTREAIVRAIAEERHAAVGRSGVMFFDDRDGSMIVNR